MGLVVAGVMLSGILAGAAMMYEMRCKACDFKTPVTFGGGFFFHQMTAWCNSCDKFVYIRWNRDDPKPEPIGKIWDAATGRHIDVYACTTCKKPVAIVTEREDASTLKHCPKCGKPEFGIDPDAPILAID